MFYQIVQQPPSHAIEILIGLIFVLTMIAGITVAFIDQMKGGDGR